MKVKMADVAKELGVSKATVSLAVNGKPGVNENTRKRILDCIAQMQMEDEKLEAKERDAEASQGMKKLIRVIIINNHKLVVRDPELDLLSNVISAYDEEIRRKGYIAGLTYLDAQDGELLEAIVHECNMDLVAGVVVHATEMQPQDQAFLQQIKKPLVLYDFESPELYYSSVCFDNRGAVETALYYLFRTGAEDIGYIATSKDIYNFNIRRSAYLSVLGRRGTSGTITSLGNTIAEITQNAEEWLSKNPLPEAFLFENYQVSVGMCAALHKKGICSPSQIKLVGIDEVGDFALSDMGLVQVRVPHAQRAMTAVDILDKEIRGERTDKVRVFTSGKELVMIPADMITQG